jgi:hypothetical protein
MTILLDNEDEGRPAVGIIWHSPILSNSPDFEDIPLYDKVQRLATNL